MVSVILPLATGGGWGGKGPRARGRGGRRGGGGVGGGGGGGRGGVGGVWRGGSAGGQEVGKVRGGEGCGGVRGDAIEAALALPRHIDGAGHGARHPAGETHLDAEDALRGVLAAGSRLLDVE